MDRGPFWQIVGDARSATGQDDLAFLRSIRTRLERMSLDEIVAFEGIREDLMAESYRNDLWAAAYIINGGCSDDGFDYFRAWLIAQGRDVFDLALADPASLETAIVMDNGWDAELKEFLYLPREVYRERAGADMPESPRRPWTLTGPEWTEDSVYEMFPKLFEKAESRFGP